MTFGSLFAGIGGMDLGLERAGMKCRWQVEIDPFCQKVLRKHWPDVPKFGDICELTGDELEPVDLIAGGFPCQDISIAGNGNGLAGSRSGLFYEIIRVVRLLRSRPRFILLENVSALLNRGMGEVLSSLAQIGYDAEWDCLPSSAFGSPHQRDRGFILAYSSGEGLQRPVFAGGVCQFSVQTSAEFGNRNITCGGWWQENLPNLRMGDGVSLRMARSRVKSFGNAVVPQVSEWIGRQIVSTVEGSKCKTT